MIAIGFDPGTARLGFGVIGSAPDPYAIDYGVIVTTADMPMANRLLEIHNAVTELIVQYRPDAIAVELLALPAGLFATTAQFSRNQARSLPDL